MAIRATLPFAGVTRAASWLDPLSSWTIAGWFYAPDSSAFYNTLFTHGDTSFTLGNIWLGVDAAGVYGYIWDGGAGTHYGETNHVVAPVNTWFYAAMVFDSTANTIKLIFNGVDQGGASGLTITTPFVDSSECLLTDTSAGAPVGDVRGGYFRIWQAALTVAELVTEQTAIVAVKQTDLLSDTPVQTSIDLTDHDRARQWTATGVVITDTNDALISVVASPPVNVDVTNAITVFSTTAVFQNTLTGTTATTVWNKFVAETGVTVYGICSFGDLVTYKPSTSVFEGLTNALANTAKIASNPNQALIVAVTAGVTYYVRSNRVTAATTGTLQLSVIKGLNLATPAGTIFINDVTDGFPGVFLDQDTAYPIKFVSPFSAGETGIILTSGRVIAEDDGILGVKIYSPTFAVASTPTFVTTHYTIVGGNNNTAYVGRSQGTANATIVSVSADGVVGTTVYDLGYPSLVVLGAKQDNSVVYNVKSGTNQAVRILNLTTGATTGVLVAGTTNLGAKISMIITANDKIILPYTQTGTTVDPIKIYNTAGTTLETHTFGTNNVEKVALGADDPVSYWIWQQTSTQSTFKNALVVGGTVTKTITGTKFNDGLSQEGATNTPVRFGHSFSCFFVVIRSGTSPGVANSGLYYIDDGRFSGTGVRKPDDTYWVDTSVGTTTSTTIPNPFVEGYAAGDE